MSRRLHFVYQLLGVCLLALPIAGQAVSAAPPERPFRLCVLDQMALLQKSQVALSQAARFQQLRQQAQAKLDDDRRTLDADVRALDALKASIPAAAMAARKQDLDNRRRQLVTRGDELNRNLLQLDTSLTNIVMKTASPFIVQVEVDRGCSVLASKTTFLSVNDATLDITDDLVVRMNTAAAGQAKGR